MVDTISLALGKGLGDGADDFAGAVEVAADGLLDDDAGEGGLLVGVVDEAGVLEAADAQVHEGRRHGEVVDAAAGDAELLVDGLHAGLEADVGAGVVEAAGHEEEGAGEVGPVALVEVLAREAVDAVAGAVADPLVGVALDFALGGQAEADDGEVRRQHAVHVEVVDGRQQLAPGQIAGRAEDDELARLRQHGARRRLRQLAGRGAGVEFDGHRISSAWILIWLAATRSGALERALRCASRLTVLWHDQCPPNLRRIACTTFQAKSSSWREVKRE